MFADVHWPGLLAVFFFYGLFFFIGWRASKKKRDHSAEEVLLAGRRLPLWIAVLTMSATWVGGGYINGTAESANALGLAWVQAPWGYALSLIIGGLFFARRMREREYTTLLDPLAERFGVKMGAVLSLPAVCGEVFWSAAILTALGTTFGVILNIDFSLAIILSAAIAILYTVIGGLWSVAMTDTIQMCILLLGLLIVPFTISHVDSWWAVWEAYQTKHGSLAVLAPPWDGWNHPDWGNYYWQWWDYALLLVFGGIPWQVYFQRVLASKNADVAVRLSVVAGFICLLAAIPPIMIGMLSSVTDWAALGLSGPENPALTLPYVIRHLTNPWVASIGLGAIAAAVMSSVDSSILSASSLCTWNVVRPLLKPDLSGEKLTAVLKKAIVIIGVCATILALKVESVYALWFLCSDFVYCILFPQLVCALFDKKANRYGSLAGLIVSFVLRFGGGEPVLGISTFIPYPMIEDGMVLFPFRTLAMVSGLLTILLVSRLVKER